MAKISASNMSLFQNRLKSFKNWNGPHSAEKMAIAGFYFTGVHDSVICFSCKREFSDWRPHESPFLAHEVISSDCFYVQVNSKTINDIRNKIIIKSLLNNSLIFDSEHKYENIEAAMIDYLYNYGMIPILPKDIIKITENYLKKSILNVIFDYKKNKFSL